VEKQGKETKKKIPWYRFGSPEQEKTIQDGADAKTALAVVRSTPGRWIDHEVLGLLQNYDLVLETLASFPSDAAGLYSQGAARPLNTVDIAVEAEAEGPCPLGIHLALSAKANSPTGGQCVNANPFPKGYPKPAPRWLPSAFSKNGYDLEQAVWPVGVKAFVLKDVHAAMLLADAKTPQNPISAIIKFLRMGFSIMNPMDLELKLTTCGKRNQLTFDPDSLTALVRVYRDVQFAVGIKVPAFIKIERTKTDNVTTYVKDKNEIKMTDAVGWKTGFKQQEVKIYDGAANKPLPISTEQEERKNFKIYVKLNELELDLSEIWEKGKAFKDVPYKDLVKLDQAKTKGLGAALKGGGLIWGLAMLTGGTIDAWQKIKDVVGKFADIMQQSPQLGFKVTWEMSFLEGTFEAGLALGQGGPNANLPPEISQRYIPTKWKFKIGINVLLFGGKIEASFGILVVVPGVGKIEARVAGVLEGSIDLKGFEAEFCKGEDTTVSIGPTGKVVGRLYAVAAVESWIWTWKEEIGIEAGLQVDAFLKWSPKGTSHEFKVWSLPVQWYIVAVNSRSKTTGCKMHVLFESRLLLEEKSVEAQKAP
jgi:hypothetical protein